MFYKSEYFKNIFPYCTHLLITMWYSNENMHSVTAYISMCVYTHTYTHAHIYGYVLKYFDASLWQTKNPPIFYILSTVSCLAFRFKIDFMSNCSASCSERGSESTVTNVFSVSSFSAISFHFRF